MPAAQSGEAGTNERTAIAAVSYTRIDAAENSRGQPRPTKSTSGRGDKRDRGRRVELCKSASGKDEIESRAPKSWCARHLLCESIVITRLLYYTFSTARRLVGVDEMR